MGDEFDPGGNFAGVPVHGDVDAFRVAYYVRIGHEGVFTDQETSADASLVAARIPRRGVVRSQGVHFNFYNALVLVIDGNDGAGHDFVHPEVGKGDGWLVRRREGYCGESQEESLEACMKTHDDRWLDVVQVQAEDITGCFSCFGLPGFPGRS